MQFSRRGQIWKALILSPTDLANHLNCGHLTTYEVDRLALKIDKPERNKPSLDTLSAQGRAHEERMFIEMPTGGREIFTVKGEGKNLGTARQRANRTTHAMRRGVPFIRNAGFLEQTGTETRDGRPVFWGGSIELLRRVEGKSELGSWRYEPVDAKLALTPKADAVVQLMSYAERLASVQGEWPDEMSIYTGDKKMHTLRTADFRPYYVMMREDFESHVIDGRATYPQPVDHCERCDWEELCEPQWRKDDDLSRLTRMRGDTRTRLIEAGYPTIKAVGSMRGHVEIDEVADASMARFRKETSLRLKGRETGRPHHKVVPPTEAGKGLAALPEPTDSDFFLEIEGGMTNHGYLQYLWGIGRVSESKWQNRSRRALSPDAEREALEAFIDSVHRIYSSYPGMHVFHYGSYDVTTLTRLTEKYAIRDAELAQLIDADVFVDLYGIARDALLLPDSYGLEALERLYEFKRTGTVRNADDATFAMGQYFITKDEAQVKTVEAYVETKLQSLAKAQKFFEKKRQGLIDKGQDIPRPPLKDLDGIERNRDLTGEEAQRLGVAKERARHDARARARIEKQLVADLPADTTEWTDGDTAKRLLVDLGDFYTREARAERREWKARLEKTPDELYQDSKAIVGLEYVSKHKHEDTTRALDFVYRFDIAQQISFGVGETLINLETGRTAGQVVSIEKVDVDGVERMEIHLRRTDKDEAQPRTVVSSGVFSTKTLRRAVNDVTEYVVENGMHDGPQYQASRALLLGAVPQIEGHPFNTALDPEKTVEYILGLQNSALFIHGPPGSGKTRLLADAVEAIVASGKTVAITAGAHAIINHDVDTVVARYSGDLFDTPQIFQRGPDLKVPNRPNVTVQEKNDLMVELIEKGRLRVGAATPFFLADPRLRGKFDYLIIDEISQMSSANALAASTCARNVVAFGDGQQLGQPVKGFHPRGSGKSFMRHYVPDGIGHPANVIFLPETGRMSPRLTEAVSALAYRNELKAHPRTRPQRVHGLDPIVYGDPGDNGAGPRVVLVDHTGSRYSSSQEVDVVEKGSFPIDRPRLD